MQQILKLNCTVSIQTDYGLENLLIKKIREQFLSGCDKSRTELTNVHQKFAVYAKFLGAAQDFLMLI